MNSTKGVVWLVGLGLVAGLATGFGVPLAVSYQPASSLRVKAADAPTVSVVEVQPLEAPAVAQPVSHYDVDRDAEVERLAARNRRLLALLSALKRRQAAEAVPEVKPAVPVEPVRELRSQAVFGQR